ncbi:hypothetical protein [Terriglobus aquaticus]|uniref:Uncharacterized protein n=1 Tax=Terriglobus aquaticus TaxID=940139 RepID=A0ABW9KRH4_9BACT|nr:hypothetical protein [Terriglobus aquaticus]
MNTLVRNCATLGAALLVAGSPALLQTSLHAQTPRHVTVKSLTPYQLDLYTRSMDLSAQAFDSTAHLIRRPTQSHSNSRGGYMVRESSWYALGLLMRDQPGDRELAATILRTVLANQYTTPGKKWYGTFKRTPEEPEPLVGEVQFRGYDPNWRHFIGTTFQMILIEYPDRIPADLAKALEQSIETAVTGEIQDGRLKESYSNIALMYGVEWEFAAQRSNNAEWKQKAAAWNAEVFRLFREHNTFYEYNAPTYYGVDLYGLQLWNRYGIAPATRQMGSTMQATLWRDIADFYNPLLRNLCGPYDRSYGMDMEKYVSVTGVWLRTVLPAKQAPLPEAPTLATDHVADLWFAPFLSILGTEIPADAMAKFRTFAGPHFITRTIDAQRTATASVGRDLIYGAEATSLTKDAGHATQFHPVTAQWRTPARSIGWIRLTQSPNIDAVADSKGITITTHGNVDFMLDAQGADAAAVQANTWTLPGLRVAVSTDGAVTSEPKQTEAGEPGVAVHFRNTNHIRLDFTRTR